MRFALAALVLASSTVSLWAARCPEPYEFSRCGPGAQTPGTSYLECECTSPTVGEILDGAEEQSSPAFEPPSPALEDSLGGRFVAVRLSVVEAEAPVDRLPGVRRDRGFDVIFVPVTEPDRTLDARARVRAVVDRHGRVVEAEVVDAPEGGFGPFAKRMVLGCRFRAGRKASRAVPVAVTIEVAYSPLFPR